MSDRLHALSFDVEEYFQVANFAERFPRERWNEIPSRLDVGMECILDLLADHDAHATFFFLGWVAERRPDMVERCLEGGHEVASHGYDHRFLGKIGPDGLDEDLERTEEALMRAGAPRPTGFRASTFTLTRETFWALDRLVARGYRYDSSIHPVQHPTYGIPDFPPGISTVEAPGGGRLVEFPVTTWRFGGRNWPVGGGGYFRLLPGACTRAAVRGKQRRGEPAALYLHPWEFDPAQPRVGAAWHKRFRHYLNLDRTGPRLKSLLEGFRFGSYREVLEREGWLGDQPAD